MHILFFCTDKFCTNIKLITHTDIVQIKGGQVCDILHMYHIPSLHVKVEHFTIVNLQENIVSIHTVTIFLFFVN